MSQLQPPSVAGAQSLSARKKTPLTCRHPHNYRPTGLARILGLLQDVSHKVEERTR